MSVVSEWWHEFENAVDSIFDSITDVFIDIFDELRNWLEDAFEWIQEYFPEIVIALLVIYMALCIVYTGGIALALNAAAADFAYAYCTIESYVVAVGAYISMFLEAIHFSTWVKINNIASILSADYRKFTVQLWSDISEWGAAIGLGAGYLVNLLQNVKLLVFDTASLFGKNYDMAELEWMNRLSGFLTDVGQFGVFFAANPGGLLLMLEATFVRPYHDTKSQFSLNVLSFIDSTNTILNDTVPKVATLRKDLEKTILDLPSNISRPIYERMEKSFDEFDTFIDDKYTPVMNQITQVTDILNDRQSVSERKLRDVVDSLLHPVDIIANIDKMPDIERIEQERRLTELTTRSYRTESIERNQAIDEGQKELQRIADAMRYEKEPPEYLRLEYEGKQPKTGIPGGGFVTWQVGDY